MRTIKFRGKPIQMTLPSGEELLGDFVVGNLITHKDGVCRILVPIDGGFENHKVSPSTVGQFTGLYDKNGKEIYEGDIVGCHNPNIKHLIFYNEKQGRFMAALNGDIENDFIGVCGLDDSRWTGSKKVIGNVYDNPELLKEELY